MEKLYYLDVYQLWNDDWCKLHNEVALGFLLPFCNASAQRYKQPPTDLTAALLLGQESHVDFFFISFYYFIGIKYSSFGQIESHKFTPMFVEHK